MERVPAEGRLVVLHIGLPKTGTTHLQRQIFPRGRDLTFAHRNLTPEWQGLCHGLRRYARAPGLIAPFLRHRVASGLRAAAPVDPGTLLVSDENIAVDAQSLWRDRGPSPESLAARLAALAETVAPLGQLRVLVGVRRQDQWLASRYAESARDNPDFGQVDFDRRMARLHATAALSGPWRWADYAHVEQTFAAALGTENVMLLSLEHLAARPIAAQNAIGRFLGTRFPRKRGGQRRRNNTLALGEDNWRLRGGGGLILKPDVRDMILERFSASNAELGARLDLGF
ncbi:MAG: hypothetical protein DI556_07295 [Rhodovulum sulfidophilum]|uniref:Sulfotransferase domain-containing protein n=1 Tax=Rhodovulum sulfidophilum TaxID=35806 RepID=A0A2W5NA31_RHOSU|nr:MAG: hypothetical protein DI556_07295 [Rhodovulum sulfidophilum]